MERQPELVAAAAAVRAWVLTQRATWEAARPTAAVTLEPDLLEESEFAPRAFAAARLETASASGAPVFTPLEPVELVSASDLLFDPPEAGVLTASGEQEQARPRRASIQLPWAKAARIGMRAAAALALVASIGAAGAWGRSAYTRYAAAPKVGTVVLESVQGEAEVRVDNASVGTTPLRLDLPAGPHDVEFRRQKTTRTMRVNVVKGQSTLTRIDWSPVRIGSLRVDSTPVGATLTVDGKVRGVTPATLDDLVVGTHTVVLESSAGTVRRRVRIAEGQTEMLSEDIFPGWLYVAAPVEVSVSEKGQNLRLDTSHRVLLPPGRHELLVENRALGIAEVRQVDIEPGATATISLDSSESSVTVSTSVDAMVSIDGVPAGTAPVTQGGLRVGSHEITAVDAAGNTRRRTVRVTAQPTDVYIDFSTR